MFWKTILNCKTPHILKTQGKWVRQYVYKKGEIHWMAMAIVWNRSIVRWHSFCSVLCSFQHIHVLKTIQCFEKQFWFLKTPQILKTSMCDDTCKKKRFDWTETSDLLQGHTKKNSYLFDYFHWWRVPQFRFSFLLLCTGKFFHILRILDCGMFFNINSLWVFSFSGRFYRKNPSQCDKI